MANTADELFAAVEKYINKGTNNPTFKKNALTNLHRLRPFVKAASVVAPPSAGSVTAIALFDEPLPNNGQDPNVESYAKPANGDTREDWFARHGESIEASFCKTVTDFVRPGQALDELQKLVGETLDQQSIDVTKRTVVARQQRWIDYFAGKLPFASVAGDFGPNYQYLGLVDLTAIHDLGKQ